MNISELRDRIHTRINTSDRDVLEAVYLLLEQPTTNKFTLTQQELQSMNKELSDYLAGTSRGYTLEEVKAGFKRNRRKP